MFGGRKGARRSKMKIKMKSKIKIRMKSKMSLVGGLGMH